MEVLLKEKGEETVKTGKFAGSKYKELTEEALKKISKRSPGDPEALKFAKTWLLLKELGVEKETQKKYFQFQFELAKEFDLPLFLHSRNSREDFYEILNLTSF